MPSTTARRTEPQAPRAELPARLLLPALLALAFVVRLVGLAHEVEGRYYLDEGTYYHHASEILAGESSGSRPSSIRTCCITSTRCALWMASLLPGLVRAWRRRGCGVEEPLAVSWLLLRGVVALLSALTTVPVFFIGRRLGGDHGRRRGRRCC